MHPDYDPQHDRRSKGAPDFDELHGFWHDRQAPQINRFANGLVNALTITALIAAAIAILWLMISTAFADQRPGACKAYRGGEVAACIAEARK